MVFKSKKDYTFPIVFALVFLLYSIISFFEILSTKDYSILLVFGGVLLFMAVLFYTIQRTTYFELADNELICHTFFFKKRIPYSAIRKVEKQKGLYAGIKFSTSIFGLVVHYNKFDDIFITPDNEVAFIESLNQRIAK